MVFSSFTIFYHLGSNSLHNGDEALYAIISREMLITGDWLTPQVQGEPCFNKPPLKFWLTALCFRFFGTSEWVIRFWSAAAAVACVFFYRFTGERFIWREGSPMVWVFSHNMFSFHL
jgi:4-amino-4-deoxy-L-arabinose transferase-like glycosyltransferase